MSKVNVKKLKKDYSVTLHKINKEILAELDSAYLDTLTRDIVDTDSIQLTVNKYFGEDNTLFLPYEDIKKERYICLDNKYYFVIKNISEKGLGVNKVKNITAYSLEHKLVKLNIKVEDLGFFLIGSDEENSIFSLNDHMIEETGWSFGHIDDSVRYDISETGEKTEKLRWQESVDTNWHSYIKNNLCEQFECIADFDTVNKQVNLYAIDSFGDDIQISLAYDNYLKDLEKVDTSEDLITRLTLVGNEDMSILEATPSGYPYIEDYSYFIKNKEMSDELINALNKYYEMVDIRTVTWNELKEEKLKKSKELRAKKTDMNIIIAEMDALKAQIRAYKLEKDVVNEAKKLEELANKKDEYALLLPAIEALEKEVSLLEESILNINILCKRETATDENGHLIFNEALLIELKDFVYCDTYVNDSYLSVDDLIKGGRRELSLRSQPTSTWTVDNANFMSRVIPNLGSRSEFKGELSLGNLIELCSEEDTSNDIVYFVGFTQDFKSNKVTLTLSDKKLKNSTIRVLGDILNEGKMSTRQVISNRYLWVQQKNNRLNLEYNKGNVMK